PDAASQLDGTAILESAALVAAANHARLAQGLPASVTARFTPSGFEVIEPETAPP
ncbi:MAG: hypothetical protein HRF43_01125, partial [Phycisphaerae bacterium]